MARRTGIEITSLTNIGTELAANSVFPIVNLADDETQKVNVSVLGNFILANIAPNTNSNLGPIGNVTILGGTEGQVLHTYGNGHLYWATDDNTFPGGSNTAVQFNDDGEFGGNSNFTFDKTSGTLTITNIDANNVTLNTLHIPAGNGTQQQVLGIIDQNTQEIGWKTIPVYYVTVDLRDGNTYLSSPDPVLRVYPVGQRDGTYLNLNVTQI